MVVCVVVCGGLWWFVVFSATLQDCSNHFELMKTFIGISVFI